MPTSDQLIRPPAVAGLFYPDDPDMLRDIIGTYISAVPTHAKPDRVPTPKAVIVPHAGYVYSGQAAAQALSRFAPDSALITRIVLMGPCHGVAVQGLAAPKADAFATPLGTIPIDRSAINTVASMSFVTIDDAPHAEEHSLEVQLPLLQTVFGDFTLVPFAVGSATNDQVAAVLETLWGGPETRIVISSDLSHFLTQEQATSLDEQTAQSIELLDWQSLSYDHACGRIPISGLLTAAGRHNLSAERIALLTSADTAGSPDRVVGYGAWAFA